MLAVVHAVVRVKENGSCTTVWDVFHVLFGRTFVSGLRTKKNLKNYFFLNLVFLQPRIRVSPVHNQHRCYSLNPLNITPPLYTPVILVHPWDRRPTRPVCSDPSTAG